MGITRATNFQAAAESAGLAFHSLPKKEYTAISMHGVSVCRGYVEVLIFRRRRSALSMIETEEGCDYPQKNVYPHLPRI